MAPVGGEYSPAPVSSTRNASKANPGPVVTEVQIRGGRDLRQSHVAVLIPITGGRSDDPCLPEVLN
ncbi:hypothetical protein Ait01nite_080930 [Actinoplanes italicus]|uniref:Uncharacterized protein n=1 Tax=Actinoplanes italicus TaxID=113567 RepID=A0A2T0KK47_9ACTN|nr:hypothetical protein CLV67_103660 [Actinoplanes italicus]GIE35048.1 hypothetical protein Ait01nite_080930 [Actinoplanes italicus]